MPGRVVLVVTSPLALERLLGGLPRYLRNQGYEVDVVCGPGGGVERFAGTEGVAVHTVPFRREIALGHDLRALASLFSLLRSLRPDVVHAGTPKAGLLGMLAAWLARVPVRVYTLHGLRFETSDGIRWMLLRAIEKLTCALAHRVVSVSRSLTDLALTHGVVGPKKICIFGPGSANGVQLPKLAARRQTGRAKAITLGFVGRLVADKGIADLVGVFEHLYNRGTDYRLLLVGDYESGDPVDAETRTTIQTHPAITRTGYVDEPWQHYRQIDILMLPSFREGLPNVILEAGAFSIPVVAYESTGCVDAVVDGVTGLLVPAGDSIELARAVQHLAGNRALASRMGRAARLRVEQDFRPERIWRSTEALYEELLPRVRTQLPASSSDRDQPGGTKMLVNCGLSAGRDRST